MSHPREGAQPTPATTISRRDADAADPQGAPRVLKLIQFFGYGAGDMAGNMAFSLAVSFLALYYTDVALISPATVGVIFLIMRVVDSFTDLIAGSIVDRTNTRWGKFRPYILFGSVPLVLITILTFSMPAGLRGTTGAVVWASVTYFLMGSVAFTFVNIPYGSLASAMTQNRDERSKLALFRSVGAAIMQVLTAVVIGPAIQAYKGDPDGLQGALTQTLIILGILAIALFMFTFFTARETVERDVPKVGLKDSLRTLASNRALQMLSLTSVTYLVGLFAGVGITAYYARDVVGNAGFIALFVGLLFGMVLIIGWLIPGLARRFGKPRLFQAGALIGVAGVALIFFNSGGSVAMATVGYVLLGTSSGMVNTLMWNLEADTIEWGEWKTGMRTEGTTYAVFSFVRKLAQAFGGALGVWVLGWYGYDGQAAVQSESALEGIRVAAGAVPMVAFFLAAILIHFYPLTDAKHREIVAEIRERRAARTEGASAPTSDLPATDK